MHSTTNQGSEYFGSLTAEMIEKTAAVWKKVNIGLDLSVPASKFLSTKFDQLKFLSFRLLAVESFMILGKRFVWVLILDIAS